MKPFVLAHVAGLQDTALVRPATDLDDLQMRAAVYRDPVQTGIGDAYLTVIDANPSLGIGVVLISDIRESGTGRKGTRLACGLLGAEWKPDDLTVELERVFETLRVAARRSSRTSIVEVMRNLLTQTVASERRAAALSEQLTTRMLGSGSPAPTPRSGHSPGPVGPTRQGWRDRRRSSRSPATRPYAALWADSNNLHSRRCLEPAALVELATGLREIWGVGSAVRLQQPHDSATRLFARPAGDYIHIGPFIVLAEATTGENT